MSSREGDMKRSAVRIIAVLAVMFAVAAAMLVWLVGNEFEAENQLNEVRAKLGELQRQSIKAAGELSARDLKMAKLREELKQSGAVQNVNRAIPVQGGGDLLTRVKSAESEAEHARKAAEVAKDELRHAIEQSQKIEKDLKTQIIDAKNGNVAINAQGHETLGNISVDTVTLEKQLKETLEELTAAKAELLVLRHISRVARDTSVAVPPPVPAPVRPLSSTLGQLPLAGGKIHGQIKAVEAKDQFVVIQLNTITGVGIGDTLLITRQGNTVGVLKMYRVGAQNIVFATLTPDLRDKVRVGDRVTLL